MWNFTKQIGAKDLGAIKMKITFKEVEAKEIAKGGFSITKCSVTDVNG